jgi:hypothetical protein
LRDSPERSVEVAALGTDAPSIAYRAGGRTLLIVVRLAAGPGVSQRLASPPRSFSVLLATEDAAFAADPRPLSIETSGAGLVVSFARPGALVLLA